MLQSKTPLCVAIVEDDSYISDLLTIRLRKAGYNSFVVSDGLQAPQIIDERLPDGIFLDLGMPGQDGFAIISCLNMNERTRGIPIIIITGRNDTDDRKRAEANGIEHFLLKPFSDTELLARTSVLLGEGRPRRLPGPVTLI